MNALTAILLASCAVLCSANSGDLSAYLNEPATEVLSLTGQVSRNCLGARANDPACRPEALAGSSTDIWHADGTCSKLILSCLYDGMVVHLVSPGKVTEVYLGWLNDPAPNPGAVLPAACSQAAVYPRQHNNHTTVSREAIHVGENMCGSQVVALPDDVTQFSNNIHILELLDVEGLTNPRLQVISHTHVKVQCCHSSKTTSKPCIRQDTPNNSGEGTITGCTAKDFRLECFVNQTTQRYDCELGLASGATLGDPRVKYVLDGCDASSSVSDEVVALVNPGPQGNADLEVELETKNPGNPDLTTHHFTVPYLQFDGADAFTPASVSIGCRVSVVLKA